MKRQPVNTAYFCYHNMNPKGKVAADCVIRAIALATAQSWEHVVRDLTELGIKNATVCNDSKLYPKYLERLGFTKCKEPRDIFNKKITVSEWMKGNSTLMSKYVIIAKVGSHHLTCIIDDQIHDIWNPQNQTMHNYWIKSK